MLNLKGSSLVLAVAAASLAACQTMKAKPLPKPSLAAAQPAVSSKPAAPSADSLALIAAAGSGDVDAVKLILARAPDLKAVDAYGRTALIAAAAGGHPQTVRLLAGAGADVNARTAKGDTALILAAGADRAQVARTLLALGADAESQDAAGLTALKAAQGADADDVAVLLKARLQTVSKR